MGLNIHRKIPITEEIVKTCKCCKLNYDKDANFCSYCGKKLTKKTASKVYANIGKNGISSISVKTDNDVTINSKRGTTVPLGNGLSYTSSNNSKKK